MLSLANRFELSEGRAAVRRLFGLGALLLVLTLAGAAGLLAAGSQALDAYEAHKDQTILTSVAMRRLSRVANDVNVAAKSPEAASLLGLTQAPNGKGEAGDFLKGDFLIKDRGNDWAVVLDGGGRVLIAQSTPRGARPAAILADAARLIDEARSSPDGSASDLTMIDGGAFLTAASRLRQVPPGLVGPVVAVLGQRVDTEVLTAAERLGVLGARVTAQPTPGTTSIILYNQAHQPVVHVAWPQQHPGLRALRDGALLLTVGFLLLAVLVAAVGWQIVRVARRLIAYEHAYGDAMQALSDARDRAEGANIAKSQFLANMSHEIRTPLNGVLGMAQVLALSDLRPDDRKKLQIIRSSGETLLSLLNDILDLSKIEAGCMDIDVEEFDLEDLVAAATQPFAQIAAQKGLAFAVDFDPEARGMWRGDGGRLRQVLGNLASNAVKFTDQGEVRIDVRRSAEGVSCAVRDTGIGIPEDRLALLFQRFSQIDPTATRKVGGTGLGLAITRDLIELMGGAVSVTSVPGQGSTFAFNLPLSWAGPPQKTVPATGKADGLPAIRVLAAEDNGVNQMILMAILEPLGVRMQMASDGEEAVEAYRTGVFDLVLMDIQMPVMNGIEAARAIRRLEAEAGRSPTPILALSANVMQHQVADYLAAGMDGLVAKPLEVRALLDALHKALAGRDGGPAAEAVAV